MLNATPNTVPNVTSKDLADRRWITVLEVLVIVILPLLLISWWHTVPENGYLYDDAYISFRYSLNLASGHGLVWNVGGEPTQGYTNFLFVILTAVGIKVGASAEATAHVLNAVGLALIGLAIYAMMRQYSKRPFLRMIPALIGVIAPLSLLNAMTGMETVFWTGFVFVPMAFVLIYLGDPRRRWLIAFAVTAFMGCLTRPESVLLTILWFGVLFVAATGKRRDVLVAGLAFGFVGLLYVAWLHAYFGAVLPNSFFVKVADTARLPGRQYVEEFLTGQVLTFGWFLVPIVGLALIPWRRLVLLAALHLPVLSLLVFYLFAFPLMGLYHRFLHPAGVSLLVLVALGLVTVLDRTLNLAEQRYLRTRQQAPEIAPWVWTGARAIIAVGIIAMLVWPCLQLISSSLIQPFGAGSLFYANRRAGLILASLPDAAAITVAYNDVGIMPYVSGVKNLDTVGLNNNAIARNAKAEGFLWVVKYILDSTPDALAFYTFPDGKVYNFGHGMIGGYYSVITDTAFFKENYACGGAFDAEWVHIQWYVYRQSPYFSELQTALQRDADLKTCQALNPYQ
jgi:hypothetical protein